MCHEASGMAALCENRYRTVRRACRARRNIENRLGSCLAIMVERSLSPLRESRMQENLATTLSIDGRFAGSTCVISSIRSCINSKP